MTGDSRVDRAFAWIDHVASRASEITWPVYVRERRRPNRLLGSAVLLRLRDESFLITAAHVLDKTRRGALRVATPRGIRTVYGRRYVTRKPANGDRDGDKLDIAVLHLASPVASAFPDSAFATWADLSPRPDEVPPQDLLLVGYPVSTQPKQRTRDVLEASEYRLLTSPLPTASYAILGLNTDRSILAGFTKDDSYRLTGRSTAPDLYGMSGCGLWFISGPTGSPRARPKLAGIAIEWRRDRPKCIVATRLIVALAPLLGALGISEGANT